MSEPKNHRQLFDTDTWRAIRERLEAEQKALQDKAFYANLTAQDINFLKALSIGWSNTEANPAD
jgi:hypothetical protein